MAQLLSAGEFASRGEERTAQELQKLPKDWVIVANKCLATSQNRSFEIDFIILADHWVFAIDEKSWRGPIHGSDTIWVREGGSSERSPLTKIDYVARVLAGYLRERVSHLSSLKDHFVLGSVVLSEATKQPALRDPRAAHVFRLDTVVNGLIKRDSEGGSAQIGELRAKISRSLYDLTDRPKFPRSINMYSIDEVSSGPHGSYTFRATHATGDERLLAVYNVAAADQSTKTMYLTQFEALKTLQATGIVPAVSDPFSWSDDFWVIPFHPPAGTALRALPRASGPQTHDSVLDLATACFTALATVHTAGIVHRALSPDHVFVTPGTPPHIMLDGFFSARTDTTNTISSNLDELRIIDPYAAPEISLSYGFATETSDVYAMALIFLEHLSGIPVDRLKHGPHGSGSVSEIDIPRASDQNARAYLPDTIVDGLISLFHDCLSTDAAQRPTAQQCVERLQESAQAAAVVDDPQEDQVLDGRYSVVRMLGTGSSARTILVRDTEADGLFVVKQFLRPSLFQENSDARREFAALRGLQHPNLPRIYDIYPITNHVQIKMEYIEGARLSQRLPDFKGQMHRWQELATQLLSALQLLEQHHIVHRDIKPDNVMIRDNSGWPVLIDFGLAIESGTLANPAGTPRYWPPQAFTLDQPPTDMDRYALAVLLFEALIGRAPFVEDTPLLNQRTLIPLHTLLPAEQSVGKVLLRAISPVPDERFTSALDFHNALRAAMVTDGTQNAAADAFHTSVSEQSNPWVESVRGLFRNSWRGNADNRGLDSEFARTTYVPTALDIRILPDIFSHKPSAVFLSGNPGDGKTAFLEKVRMSLRDHGATRTQEDDSGWEYVLDGWTYRACYDASEAHNGKTADEQLNSRLHGLHGTTKPVAHLTVLVAINDGRLAAWAENNQGFDWLASEIGRATDTTLGDAPAADVWVIDLKQRAYISAIPQATPISVFRQLLAILVDPIHWAETCGDCSAAATCPILSNARALRQRHDSLPGADARLEYALLLAYMRGNRHLTIRDLKSGLAYLITADLSCADVHAARRRDDTLMAVDHAYWNLAYTTSSQRDIMLGELQTLDPGRFAYPRLERYFFFHQAPDQRAQRIRLFANDVDLPPIVATDEWLAQIKRRLYFESAGVQDDGIPHIDWPNLLPYRHARTFLAIMNREDDGAAVLSDLLRGLSHSDGLHHQLVRSTTGLVLRVAHSDAQHMTIAKQFGGDAFTLAVAQTSGSTRIEHLANSIVLRHLPSKAQVRIALDLYEILLRLGAGDAPDSPELEALLEDLKPFKNRVHRSNGVDFVLIENERRQRILTQIEGQIVLQTGRQSS